MLAEEMSGISLSLSPSLSRSSGGGQALDEDAAGSHGGSVSQAAASNSICTLFLASATLCGVASARKRLTWRLLVCLMNDSHPRPSTLMYGNEAQLLMHLRLNVG